MTLEKEVGHEPVLVDSPPSSVAYAIDAHTHIVEMPPGRGV